MKRRLFAMLGIGFAALLLTSCFPTSAEENTAFSLVNGDRAGNGVSALVTHDALTDKAQKWAQHLLAASGGTCSGATLAHSDLRDMAPAGWRLLGENVGCRIAPGDALSAMGPLESGFMNSAGHRANILNGSYNVGGTGVASAPTSYGYLLVYETQEFAAV